MLDSRDIGPISRHTSPHEQWDQAGEWTVARGLMAARSSSSTPDYMGLVDLPKWFKHEKASRDSPCPIVQAPCCEEPCVLPFLSPVLLSFGKLMWIEKVKVVGHGNCLRQVG